MMDATQLSHARAMVAEVQRRRLPARAAVVVLATGLVESNLTIYANVNVPSSLSVPHEAEGSDHASVGVLQQQVPSWGATVDCMDPATAAGKFLSGTGNNPGLLTLPGYRFRLVGYPTATSWTQLPIGAAAQAVQVSAFPDRYQERADQAQTLVDQLWVKPIPAATIPPLEDDMYIRFINSGPRNNNNAVYRVGDAHLLYIGGMDYGWIGKPPVHVVDSRSVFWRLPVVPGTPDYRGK